MALMSAAAELGSPGTGRGPCISTTVRFEPRLRRLIVAVPVEPLERLPDCEAKACGSALTISSARVAPERRTSWLLTTGGGLTGVRFGCGMREPVMTMAPWSSPLAAGLAASTGPDWG